MSYSEVCGEFPVLAGKDYSVILLQTNLLYPTDPLYFVDFSASRSYPADRLLGADFPKKWLICFGTEVQAKNFVRGVAEAYLEQILKICCPVWRRARSPREGVQSLARQRFLVYSRRRVCPKNTRVLPGGMLVRN